MPDRFYLLLYSKYGEKMIYDDKDHEGIFLRVSPENLGTVKGRVSRLGDVLSETKYNDYSNILASIPSYLTDEFLEPIKRLEIPYYRQNHDNFIKGD